MPKNNGAYTDAMVNAALADHPTPNKVWLVLIDENEASYSADDDVWSDLTWSTTEKLPITSVSCVDRIIDLGGPHDFAGTTETPSAIAVLSDQPSGSPEILLVQDLAEDGSAFNFAFLGTCRVNTLLIRHGYQDET